MSERKPVRLNCFIQLAIKQEFLLELLNILK